MSEELNKAPKIKVAEPQSGGISRSDLESIVAMVAAAMKGSSEATAEAIGKAMIEAQTYESPEQKLNKERERESQRELIRRERRQKKFEQASCPHQKGALGETPSRDLSAFIRHELDTGLVVLICTACQKTVYSDTQDPEEAKFFRWPTNNRASTAGRRVFLDPRTVQQRGHPVVHSEEPEPAIAVG